MNLPKQDQSLGVRKPYLTFDPNTQFIFPNSITHIMDIPAINRWADFWRYTVGVNVIPAVGISKKPLVSWKEDKRGNWQIEPKLQEGSIHKHSSELNGQYVEILNV